MNNLLDAFEAAAEKYPDKTAAACRGEAFTFRELKERSARLGQRIKEVMAEDSSASGITLSDLFDQFVPEPAAGSYDENHSAEVRKHSAAENAAPGQPVGVMAGRDAETILLFLAVLYSGNFYVAIDPDMPTGKLRKILEDAAPAIVLTSVRPSQAQSAPDSREEPQGDSREYEALFARLREAGFTGRILTEDDAAAVPTENPHLPASAPAYMIYTSGSTGTPKGVLKSHGAVLSFQEAYQNTFGLGAEEIIGNQTPFFFDASAKDIYLMATSGATLEVLPPELFVFPVTLIRYLNERHITYVCWVPTALAIVTQLGTFQEVVPETLKKVFFVGEVFPLKQLRKWQETLPDIEYVNLYGSTELAGVACWCRIGAKELAEETLPIGRPLSNCQVRLADEAGNTITGPDQTGEIRIAGPALAEGYYHDPEKTAQTFVIRSSGISAGQTAEPGVRELRTGDLARFDHEGLLHFVSRSDDQIKLQGRRIELGEITAAADRLPEIRRCCALFNEKRKKITLFAELTPGCEEGPRDIIRKLKGMLSDYMVPGKVILLDQMPLNANGKIDRTRLKEMMPQS